MFRDTQPTSPVATVYSSDASLPFMPVDLSGNSYHFATGQFAGRSIRAELLEIQKADMGRK